MATIPVIRQSILLIRESGCTAPAYIHGHRGIGKSSVVKQLCEENNWGFIDLRAAQIEASDIRGLPDKIDGRTHFLPPSDMPLGDMDEAAIDAEFMKAIGLNYADAKAKYEATVKGKSDDKNFKPFTLEEQRVFLVTSQRLQPRMANGILFLDEVNRAADDVMQALFQLVLDRKVGQYVLPPGWTIVAAGNFNKGYNTNGFTDAAMVNRFCHLTLSTGESTVEDWVSWITTQHGGDASSVIEFASQNVDHLDGKLEGDIGLTVQPARRSWENIIRLEKVRSRFPNEVFTEVAAGLIGRELALSYSAYSCPVKPRDLLNNGVARYESALKKLSRGQQIGLSWGMVSVCRETLDTEKTATVCLDLAEYLLREAKDRDVVVGFIRACVGAKALTDQDRTKIAMISNPKLAQAVSRVTAKANQPKGFFDHLVARPVLHEVIGKTAWGSV